MNHINYHQFFTQALDIKDDDVIRHANNQIMKNVILLIDQYTFNHFYADIFEAVIKFNRLSTEEKCHETCNMIINDLKNKNVFGENSIILQDVFYHALIITKKFWSCHKSAFEYFIECNKDS